MFWEHEAYSYIRKSIFSSFNFTFVDGRLQLALFIRRRNFRVNDVLGKSRKMCDGAL